eukprot:SM000018S03572  [mRNA]  locus=s18:54120:54797:- [translate_table: standard]
MNAGTRLCRRCKRQFDPHQNEVAACAYHRGLFVCRRHDDQKRWALTTASLSPQRHRYYELKDGEGPYAARFYDCCGAESEEAPGCTQSPHITFDED